jgi:putative Holliday junction resolvase
MAPITPATARNLRAHRLLRITSRDVEDVDSVGNVGSVGPPPSKARMGSSVNKERLFQGYTSYTPYTFYVCAVIVRPRMRFVGVDFGAKRIGLAVSDATGLLARPWQVTAAGPTPDGSARLVADLLAPLVGDEDGVAGIVVGLPRRLDGRDTDQTAPARTFATTLARLSDRPVHLQDERLTSHEADARLAEHERDWRKRKKQIDATAASIILQDYLDARPGPLLRREP